MVAISAQSENRAACADVIGAACIATSSVPVRTTLLRALAQVGGANALWTVRTALDATDAPTVDAAIRAGKPSYPEGSTANAATSGRPRLSPEPQCQARRTGMQLGRRGAWRGRVHCGFAGCIGCGRFSPAATACPPTRRCAMAGRHPNSFGCFKWSHTLHPLETMISEALKPAGYAVGGSGKRHPGCVREDSPVNPGASGLDEWLSAGSSYDHDPLLSREVTAVQR